MKKFYFLVVFVFCAIYMVNAQYLNEDFEGGLPADWTAENVWKVGNAASHSSQWFNFPAHGNFAGVNDDALGAGGSAAGKLITNDLDLTAAEHVMLSFDLYYLHADYDGAGQETFKVLYSEDGTTWTEIYDVNFGIGWGRIYVVAPELAGKVVKLAFDYFDGNNWSYGAGIDNILLEDQPEYFGLTYAPNPDWKKINTPEETVSFDFPYTYLGHADVSEYTVEYSVDGGDVQSMVVTEPVVSGDISNITLDGFGLGEHTVTAKVIFSEDYSLNFPEMTVEAVPPVPGYVQMDIDGVERDLHADLAAGKVVVVDFFASWCGPCETSTPLINEVWEEMGRGEEDFQVYGLTVEATDDVGVVAGLNWGGEYPAFAYSDRNELVWQVFNAEYGENAIPTFIMICPNYDSRSGGGPGFSEVIWSTVGWPGDGKAQIQNAMGTCDLSPVVNQEFTEYNVYPNPFEDYLDVQFELDEEMFTEIYIADNFGRTVKVLLKGKSISSYNSTVQLGDLDAGVYYLTIETEKGTSVKKIVRM